MEATLKGPYGQTILEPSPYPYIIGRTPDNQLVVNDPQASSHHAQILRDGQGYILTDIGSTNGTFVNERRLVPNLARLLQAGDTIRIGDTRFVFETAGMPQTQVEPTVYAGFGQGSNPSYPPVAAATPPYMGNSFGVQQGGYAPPPPVQKPSRRGLWIALSAIVGILLIGAIVFSVIGYVNRSTPTKTLNAFCNALKGGNYQTAYNQLSSGLQAKFGSEAQFAAGYSTNAGLGKITGCTVGNVDDGAGTGTLSYSLSGGSSSSLVVDYTLIDENGVSKINAQHPRSNPALTLTTYCNAMVGGDYQTAYNQFSSSAQSQIGTEAQFAAFATSLKLKDCTVSNVNDTAGTGTVTYIRGDGNKVSAVETLVKENGTWKIKAQQFISSPTETLLTYCSALKTQDYQTAYSQLSSSAQSQETEAQFAANFNSIKVTECAVSNVNDTAGTAMITYTLGDGRTAVLYYTLVNENAAWKINSEQTHP
jgi:hypothetical protein